MRAWPHQRGIRPERAAQHREIGRGTRAAGNDSVFRHIGAGHRGHELGAVFGDTLTLDGGPDHEAGDVDQEQ